MKARILRGVNCTCAQRSSERNAAAVYQEPKAAQAALSNQLRQRERRKSPLAQRHASTRRKTCRRDSCQGFLVVLSFQITLSVMISDSDSRFAHISVRRAQNCTDELNAPLDVANESVFIILRWLRSGTRRSRRIIRVSPALQTGALLQEICIQNGNPTKFASRIASHKTWNRDADDHADSKLIPRLLAQPDCRTRVDGTSGKSLPLLPGNILPLCGQSDARQLAARSTQHAGCAQEPQRWAAPQSRRLRHPRCIHPRQRRTPDAEPHPGPLQRTLRRGAPA